MRNGDTLSVKVYNRAQYNATVHWHEIRQFRTGRLAIFPDSVIRLHTTRTPEFLGLSSSDGLWPLSHYGDDVNVGMLDAGTWLERKSFNNQGLMSVPNGRENVKWALNSMLSNATTNSLEHVSFSKDMKPSMVVSTKNLLVMGLD